MQEVLTLPFRLRGCDGRVRVALGVNAEPRRWGYHLLGFDDWEEVSDFPVLQAETDFGAEGYMSELQWIQVVWLSVPDQEHEPLCDTAPQLQGLGMPFMFWGVRPTFFDAPADDRFADLTWNATTFLTQTPTCLMTRVVGPVVGFRWGFRRDAGRTSSLPVEEAGAADWREVTDFLRPAFPAWEFLDIGPLPQDGRYGPQ